MNRLPPALKCKVEGNLIEYPLFYFGKAVLPKQTYEFTETKGEKKIHRKFTVSNGSGIPGALGQDCLIALLILNEEQKEGSIHFFIQEIGRILFGKKKGRSRTARRLVKQNLQRLAHTMVDFEDSFRTAEGEYVTQEIGPLFAGASLYTHRAKNNTLLAWKENLFRLGDNFQKNIEGRYFNWINHNYWKVKSGIPRRLFLYLTKKSNGGKRPAFTISLDKLYPRIPISSPYPGRRFEYLARACKELKKVGITHKFGKGIIEFFFPQELKKEVKAEKISVPKLERLVEKFYGALGINVLSHKRRTEGVEILRRIQKEERRISSARMEQIIGWILERRGTDFRKLHSIRIVEQVWDQALSFLENSERAKRGAQTRKENQKAKSARDSDRKMRIDKVRAALSSSEQRRIQKDAEKRLHSERRFAFTLSAIEREKNPVLRKERLGGVLRSIEEEILLNLS